MEKQEKKLTLKEKYKLEEALGIKRRLRLPKSKDKPNSHVHKIKKMMYHEDGSVKKKGNPYLETVKFNIRMGVGVGSFSTSITLRKNIVALWILMMGRGDQDPYEVVQEFIEKVCLKRWEGDTARGMSDFVSKCMINSFLEEEDFRIYKKIYLAM